MAAGFKSATVTSGDVPSTQSNFPAYVDLSRLGITTQAEADSVRCYSDEAKTTELAREIVSVSEMHVKIPSLTNTFTLYVDWDGSSADYAVDATYGRNNVWSGYRAVYHLQSLTADSTVNGYSLTNANSVGSATNKIGSGADSGTSNTNKRLHNSSDLGVTTGNLSMSLWVRVRTQPSSGGVHTFFDHRDGGSGVMQRIEYYNNSGTYQVGCNWARNGVSDYYAWETVNLGTSDWHHIVLTYAPTTVRNYRNGEERASQTTATGSGSGITDGTSIFSTANGFLFSSAYIDEVRFAGAQLSADWITTEYNNQSDESGFWGTWSDVSAGATFVPKIAMY